MFIRCTVPNVIGMRGNAAVSALRAAGFRLGNVSKCWNKRARTVYNDCTIRDQKPVGEADPGAAINLKVDLPPELQGGPSPPPPPAPPPKGDECDPSYPDVCLDPYALDYDCLEGEGDGPLYVPGPIRVRPPDPYDLDRDSNGVGCEP